MNKPQPLSNLQAKLADLYFQSGTVMFGAFKLAAHESQPDLPPTPLYMHYPKPGEPDVELLPAIYGLIGKLFADIISSEALSFDKLCAIPSGADPLATETARSLNLNNQQLLSFDKQLINGKRVFGGPTIGELESDETVLILDDHTSGGYTKSLFIDYLESCGARVTDVLTVVDREQGAIDYLGKRGVTMHSIITLSQLLDYYESRKLITSIQASEVRTYISQNQIKV